MEFSIKTGAPEKRRADCLVLGVFDNGRLSVPAQAVDAACQGALAEILKLGDLEAAAGATLLLHRLPNIAASRVLLVQLGREKDFRDAEFRSVALAAWKAVQKTGAQDVACYLAEVTPKRRDVAWTTAELVSAAHQAAYQLTECKSNPEPKAFPRKLLLAVSQRSDERAAEAGLVLGRALGAAMNQARRLADLPGNICTPSYLAETAQTMAAQHALTVTVLERADMEALGMGSLLSVARGSVEPPKFIVLEYRGAGDKKPVVLVGKGITFDSGGISLKPGEGMDEMKYDMSGAAAVLATMNAVAELKLAINLVVIVPTCENLPAGNANKPGDIVRSMSGQTIEVLNTDAEGRLILCDALTYAERFKPAAVIDVATLTGACVIALGHVTSGLYANDDALARDLLQAAEVSGDRAWRMPLFDDYQEQLKSPFADMANIGGRPAGSITAACFLSRFAKAYRWAHLDIAGTAWKSGASKGATGRPVPLLLHYLAARASQK